MTNHSSPAPTLAMVARVLADPTFKCDYCGAKTTECAVASFSNSPCGA